MQLTNYNQGGTAESRPFVPEWMEGFCFVR